MTKRLTIEEVKEKIEELHPGSKLLSTEYKNANSKLDILCGKEHKFSMTYGNVQQGHWCAECSGRKKHTIEEVKETIESRHPGSRLISTEYKNANSKLDIICENGHKISIKYNDVQQYYWCAECSGNKKLTIEEVKEKIENMHPGCKVISTEYKNAKEKLDIICENGHKISIKYNDVQQGQWCAVCGWERGSRKTNKPSVKLHWKTGEECWCQGGYEPKVIDYFNKNKIDFIWQNSYNPVKLSTGRTYRPDVHLPELDLWVEIKGRMFPLGLEKWTEFHERYPNSELWDKAKLKSLGIL